MKHIVLSRILHIFPSKAPFCYLKYFWKKINLGQYGLLHNDVHLVNFGQSLSKSHIIRFMLNFTIFPATSVQEAIGAIRFDPYCQYKIFIKFGQKLILFSISKAFKKLNWRKHNLTHIVVILIFFDWHCIFQSFLQFLIKGQYSLILVILV